MNISTQTEEPYLLLLVVNRNGKQRRVQETNRMKCPNDDKRNPARKRMTERSAQMFG